MTKKRILVAESILDRILFFIERFGDNYLDIVETSAGANSYLSETVYDFIFLGGDLGPDDSCFFVAKFLEANKNNPNNDSMVVIHTWNTSEALLMMQLLPKAVHYPFDEARYSVLRI